MLSQVIADEYRDISSPPLGEIEGTLDGATAYRYADFVVIAAPNRFVFYRSATEDWLFSFQIDQISIACSTNVCRVRTSSPEF